jgi:hypothetical protein
VFVRNLCDPQLFNPGSGGLVPITTTAPDNSKRVGILVGFVYNKF